VTVERQGTAAANRLEEKKKAAWPDNHALGTIIREALKKRGGKNRF